MEINIMEWNIHQAVNFARQNMPEWIADVILESNVDIIALTEVYRGNNWESIKKKAFPSNYYLFETNNEQCGQNDIAIAVNSDKIDVIYTKSFFPQKYEIPDYLEIMCREKETNKEFLFVCLRIHDMSKVEDRDSKKIKGFSYILENTKNKENVVICGDFNNNRRGFEENGRWHLSKIDEMIQQYSFKRKTPEGSSIYEESKGNLDYEFAEDHFFIKGIKDISLMPYDRSFTEKDKKVYKWDKDFQKYLGKNYEGKNMYESVPAPFPDHAILRGTIITDDIIL
ncbi:MAG: endonuclease/exonuclease/phosphatase family protein [Lachnospiraceae bacterium]|nr:endonuclease/exonuclease/phosphatase family protein [Lachnospiraceae bacterium]